MVQQAMILHFFNYVSSAGDTYSKTLNYSMSVCVMTPFDLLFVTLAAFQSLIHSISYEFSGDFIVHYTDKKLLLLEVFI